MGKECLLGEATSELSPGAHTAEWRVQNGCHHLKTWHIRAVQILAGHPEHSYLITILLTRCAGTPQWPA